MTLIFVLMALALGVALGFGLAVLLRKRAQAPAPHIQERIRRLIQHAVEIRFSHEKEEPLHHDEGHRQEACEERVVHYLFNAQLPEPPNLSALVSEEIATQLHAMAKASRKQSSGV